MLWRGIKSIVTMKPKNFDTLTHLTDMSGSHIKDPVKIANQFSHFFTSVASDITQNIPRNPRSALSYPINPKPYSCFIFPCTPDEVSDVIKSLKNGKSSGPNSILVKLLKILDRYISAHLSILIKESLGSGIFLNKLKIARVIPIFKKRLTKKMSNYGPISLLSIFSKITEKLQHKRL